MMSWLNQLNQYVAAILVLVLSVTAVVLYLSKFWVRFWWMNFWCSIPVIGTIADLSKDSNLSRTPGWATAEQTLCRKYSEYISLLSEHEFNERLEYLKKAQDSNRTPLPVWLVISLIILVIAEGLGFSYMLGSWIAGESGSENTRQLLMFAVAAVIGGALVYLTHLAGHQYYRSRLLQQLTDDWKRESPNDRDPLRAKIISLKDWQGEDDGQSLLRQCAHRVGTSAEKPRYGFVWAAVLAITVIAVGSTGMRIYHLESVQIQETIDSQREARNLSRSGGEHLPSDVADPQIAAEQAGIVDGHKPQFSEGLMAFIMLGFIFVMTQYVGITAGMKWGFLGNDSDAAYDETRGFKVYRAYREYYEPILQCARAKLQILQQRLMKSADIPLQLGKTFDDFLAEERTRAGEEAKHAAEEGRRKAEAGRRRAAEERKYQAEEREREREDKVERKVVPESFHSNHATMVQQPADITDGPVQGDRNALLSQYMAIPLNDVEGRRQFVTSIQPEILEGLKEQFKQILKEKKDKDAKQKAEQKERDLEGLV